MKKLVLKARHSLAVAVALCFGAVSAFAEGSGNTIDTTAATNALSDMSTAIVGFITAAIPYVVSILGGGLVIVLIFLGLSWLKKGAKKAG